MSHFKTHNLTNATVFNYNETILICNTVNNIFIPFALKPNYVHFCFEFALRLNTNQRNWCIRLLTFDHDLIKYSFIGYFIDLNVKITKAF